MGELLKHIHYGNILIPGAEGEQGKFYYLWGDLKKCNPRIEKNINKKTSLLENIQNFYNGREMVFNAFINKIIQLAHGSYSQ